MRSCEYTINPRITIPMKESSSFGATLKLVEATLEIGGRELSIYPDEYINIS
jgi:hypothetical protein